MGVCGTVEMIDAGVLVGAECILCMLVGAECILCIDPVGSSGRGGGLGS